MTAQPTVGLPEMMDEASSRTDREMVQYGRAVTREVVRAEVGEPSARVLCIAFASRLILAVRMPREAALESITIRDRFGSRRELVSFQTIRASDEGEDLPDIRLFVSDLAEVLPVSLYAAPVTVLVRTDREEIRGHVGVETLDATRELNPRIVRLIRAVADGGGVDPRVTAIFDRNCRWAALSETPNLAVDRAYETPFGVMVEGWIENLVRRDMVLMAVDLSAVCGVEAMLKFPREDVAAHLDQVVSGRAASQMHGFAAGFPGASSPMRGLYLLERVEDRVTVYGPVPIHAQPNRDAALSLALKRLDGDPQVTFEKARSLLLPALSAPNLDAEPEILRYNRASVPPHLSIVVTLSGQEIFLRSLLAQQAKLPDDIEWVLCVQRTDRSRGLASILAGAGGKLRRPTTVIWTDVDCSSARMNNIAARSAEGEILLFLDETAWVHDFRPILAALRDLRRGVFEVVGIGMTLEDGTLDHDGLEPRRHPRQPNVVVPAARERGLPAWEGDSARTTTRRVKAASVSGMVVRRAYFEDMGGFDEAFHTPGYFDLDFSLRVGLCGGRVGLVRRDGVSRGLKLHGISPVSEEVRRSRELLDGCRLHAVWSGILTDLG